MTIDPEEIFGHYRKADFTSRLNMFLQFPELRNDFLEIDQNEVQPDFFATAKPSSKCLNLINGWINRSFSFLL